MYTIQAFSKCESARARGAKLRVFDWDKAARLIRERGASSASAGLSGDWEWTGGTILEDGKPVLESYTYLASLWATPEIEIDGNRTDCCIMEDSVPTEWGSDHSGRKWPESALRILRGDST